MSRQAAKTISGHFRSPGLRLYARGKIAADPVYAAALARLRGSDLPILDVGCGIGLLGFYLREAGLGNEIFGIDLDAGKIRAGAEVAREHYRGIQLMAGDAREALSGFSGSVALLDVVHYLTDEEQTQLLSAAADRVAPGGICIIRDCINDGSWRYRATYLEESFARAIGWLRVPRLNFPSLAALCQPFQSRGFGLEIAPLWGRTPYNNYLLVFSRDQRAA